MGHSNSLDTTEWPKPGLLNWGLGVAFCEFCRRERYQNAELTKPYIIWTPKSSLNLIYQDRLQPDELWWWLDPPGFLVSFLAWTASRFDFCLWTLMSQCSGLVWPERAKLRPTLGIAPDNLLWCTLRSVNAAMEARGIEPDNLLILAARRPSISALPSLSLSLQRNGFHPSRHALSQLRDEFQLDFAAHRRLSQDHGKGGLSLRGVAFMTVLAVWRFWRAPCPPFACPTKYSTMRQPWWFDGFGGFGGCGDFSHGGYPP